MRGPRRYGTSRAAAQGQVSFSDGLGGEESLAKGRGRKQSRAARPARFKLSRVGSAIDDAKHVPPRLRPKITAAIERLAREGCRAADCALSGDPPWPYLCAVHVDGWRILIAFPAENEVAILKLAPHDRRSDPYSELAAELGLAVVEGPRTKPPCCDPSGEPPVDPGLVATLQGAFDVLTRRQSRGRSQR